jgi:hypothetical protein
MPLIGLFSGIPAAIVESAPSKKSLGIKKDIDFFKFSGIIDNITCAD